jgi:hypothetical protein
MNFGTNEGLNREGDKIQMIKNSVENEINNDTPKKKIGLNNIFHNFKPKNTDKIKQAKKNKIAMKNNSPNGF